MNKTRNEQALELLEMTDRVDRNILCIGKIARESYIGHDDFWNLRKSVNYINKIASLYRITGIKRFISILLDIELSTPYINISKSIWNTIDVCKKSGHQDKLKNLRKVMDEFDTSSDYKLLCYSDNFVNQIMNSLVDIWKFLLKYEWKIDIDECLVPKRRYLGINIEKREIYVIGLFNLFKLKDNDLEYIQEVRATTSSIEYDWYETSNMGEFNINDMDVFIGKDKLP